MASELKPSSFDFGVIIAFVAPGFVTFLGLSYHMPTAAAWIDAASNMDQSVGVFLFVLLASLSLGLVVSGVRSLVIDRLLNSSWLLRRNAVPQYTIDWPKVDDTKLLVLVTIRDNYFRYYQFYSNSLVALLFWTIVRTVGTELYLTCQQLAVIFGGLAALLLASRDSLLRYVNAVNTLFKPV